jgi:hypothetical protein
MCALPHAAGQNGSAIGAKTQVPVVGASDANLTSIASPEASVFVAASVIPSSCCAAASMRVTASRESASAIDTTR